MKVIFHNNILSHVEIIALMPCRRQYVISKTRATVGIDESNRRTIIHDMHHWSSLNLKLVVPTGSYPGPRLTPPYIEARISKISKLTWFKDRFARLVRIWRVYMKYCSGERRAKGLMGRVHPSPPAYLPEYFMYYNYFSKAPGYEAARFTVSKPLWSQ